MDPQYLLVTYLTHDRESAGEIRERGYRWMTFARERVDRRKAESDKDFQTRIRPGTYCNRYCVLIASFPFAFLCCAKVDKIL